MIISGSMRVASARKSMPDGDGDADKKLSTTLGSVVSRGITVVGIDLAGSERRDTGFCVMDARMHCEIEVLRTDDEVLALTTGAAPAVVSIDAPLFLPKGRKSIEDRGPPHFRECDRELLRMHIRFLPISLGPMRMLTSRGIRLRAALGAKESETIESFPGAIQDLLHMPRKQAGLPLLAKALIDHGIDLGRAGEALNGDELDAVTSALVGMLYKGQYRAIGDPEEGPMVLPRA